MDHRLIEGLMDVVAPYIKKLEDRVAALEARQPEKGEPGRDGADGKNIDAEEVGFRAYQIAEKLIGPLVLTAVNEADFKNPEVPPEIIQEEVARQLAELPKAVDGKDGRDGVDGKDAEVDLDALALKAAELIEKPKDGADGKDADPVDLDAIAIKAAALIEKPKDGIDGKDAEPVDPTVVANLLVDLMPVPKDGKDAVVDLEALAVKAAALIEKPKDGRDAEVDLDAVALKAAELIPVPKDGCDGIDGKDAVLDPAIVTAALRDIVQEKAEILRGEPGKDADPDHVKGLVERTFTERVPVSFMVNAEGVLVANYSSGDKKDLGRVRGASVMDSKVNDDGILVLRMSDGRELQAGIVCGKDGEPGKPGEPGRAGRDALEVQVLPGIHENKSYPEGVVSIWRGGLIRSERQTDPIADGNIADAGWRTILNAIHEEAEEVLDDGRFIERVTSYTNGTEFRRRIKTVTPIDQSVWAPREYLKGDGVTYNGGWFIAQRDTSATDVPQDKGGAWRLAAKRGRDGKDLTEPKVRGPVHVPAAATGPRKDGNGR